VFNGRFSDVNGSPTGSRGNPILWRCIQFALAVAAGEGAEVETKHGLTTIHAGRTIVIEPPAASSAPPEPTMIRVRAPRERRGRRASRTRAPPGDNDSDPHLATRLWRAGSSVLVARAVI
jgi:hypothetical protein